MWKLILGVILIATSIWGIVNFTSTTVRVFQGLWLVLGLYLIYSWYTTPPAYAPPALMGAGRRHRR